jgi:hypothetical protein
MSEELGIVPPIATAVHVPQATKQRRSLEECSRDKQTKYVLTSPECFIYKVFKCYTSFDSKPVWLDYRYGKESCQNRAENVNLRWR